MKYLHNLARVKVWLKNRIWVLPVIFWVVFSDYVESFKSHFWLALLGAIIVGLLIVAIEVGIAKLRKTVRMESICSAERQP